MAHAPAYLNISIMDSDLVSGTFRALLALHSEGEEGSCVECLGQSPCATVRLIAAFQDASIERVANLEEPENENRRQTHRFLYPECPQFSGGICNEHKDTPLAAGL